MSLSALLLAAAPLFEIELRWVDQPLVPAGVLSSAGQGSALSTQRGHGVTPLGPKLRVASGETLAWSLSLPSAPLWVTATQGQTRALLPLGTGAGQWQLVARPQWRGEGRPLRLQLRWQQQAEADGGATQSWQSGLTLAEGRWVSLLRDAPSAAPPDGALRTQATLRVRELQVRVSRVPE